MISMFSATTRWCAQQIARHDGYERLLTGCRRVNTQIAQQDKYENYIKQKVAYLTKAEHNIVRAQIA